MKTLVVNMNYLGDALMTTPTLSLLAETSGAPVDVIVGGSRGYAGLEILRGLASIRTLIGRVNGGAVSRCRQLYHVIRAGKYDLVVILPSIGIYRLTAQLAGANRVIFVPPTPDGEHMAEHILQSVASSLGAPAGPLTLSLHIPEDARRSAGELLKCIAPDVRIVALNLGASRPQKRWPVASFRETLRRLNSRGFSVVLLGSASDRVIANEIFTEFGEGDALDLTGRTSIAELCAIIERCAAIVTGDTGAMHIAAALQTPVAALFGSTDPAQTGPVGPGRSQILYKHLHCAPCKSHPTCGGRYTCMSSITPVEVMAAVTDLIETAAQRPKLRIVHT